MIGTIILNVNGLAEPVTKTCYTLRLKHFND